LREVFIVLLFNSPLTSCVFQAFNLTDLKKKEEGNKERKKLPFKQIMSRQFM
jgi:hypothetical protein